MKNRSFFVILGLGLSALLAAGCGSSSSSDTANNNNNNNNTGVLNPAGAQIQGAFVQVEQLARPVINEGLVVDNALLNAYNSVGPAFVRAALDAPGGPEAAAAAPIVTDATTTLDALLAAGGGVGGTPFSGLNGGAGPTSADFLGVFLPDTMRINTTLSRPPGTASFGSSVNANLVLDSGRKIDDDVMDVVTTVLTNNSTVIDNVPYRRPDGNMNAAIGHSTLNGQADSATVPNPNPATFPYLAPAN